MVIIKNLKKNFFHFQIKMEEYLKKKNISLKNVPDFAQNILKWKLLDDKEKKKFIKDFLIYYINDENYKNHYKDYMIVFLNRKYIGLFKNTEDFQHLRSRGDIPKSFEIGESNFFQYKSTVIRLEENSKHIHGNFMVTGNINFGTTNKKITDCPVMIDTGCNISELFPQKIWDFENEKFVKKLKNIFYGYCFEKELEELNLNILNVKSSKIHTVNGICIKNVIEFLNPIKISLENLNPVDVFFLTISLENEEEISLPLLIGLDIITQYNVNITSKNKRPIMTISDIDENEDNDSVNSNNSKKSISENIKNFIGIS